MKAISRGLSKFCYNHPRLGIPELMKYIALGNVFVFVADMLTNGMASLFLDFYPGLILRGQVWRLITFVFVPLDTGASSIFGKTFLFALSTFFYYWIGSALERQWGTTRFTVFYGLGVIFNIVAGFVIYAVLWGQLAGMGAGANQIREFLQAVPTASMSYAVSYTHLPGRRGGGCRWWSPHSRRRACRRTGRSGPPAGSPDPLRRPRSDGGGTSGSPPAGPRTAGG